LSLGASMSSSFTVSNPVTSPNNLDTQSILDQISGIATALSNQLLQWGAATLANVNSVTDSNITQYLQNAATSGILANSSVSDYLSKYVPLQDQLIQDANSYTSQARVQSEMGTAESGVAQSMDQGRVNAEQQLNSYGIDPSSGQYAELEQAQEAQKAAATAGAGQQARLATEATGRSLRSQAIAVGQQLPGQAVNALNSEVQALTGAENSALGAANTGVNLTTPGVAALNTAVSAGKFAPTGQQSVSSTLSGGGGGGGGSKGSNDPGGIDNFGRGSANQGANSAAYDPVARPVAGAPGMPSTFDPSKSTTSSVPNNGTQQYDDNGNPISPIMGPVDPNLQPPLGYNPNTPSGGTDVLNGGVDQNLLQPSGDVSGGQGTPGSQTNPFAGTPNVPAMDPGINNTGYIPGGFDQQNAPVQQAPGSDPTAGFTPPDASNGPMPALPDTSGFGNNQNFNGGYGPPAGSPGTGGYGGQPSGGYGSPAGSPGIGGYGASGGYGAPAAGGYSPGAGGQYSPGAGGQEGGVYSGGGGYTPGHSPGYSPGYSPGSQTSSGYGGGGYGGGGYARGGAIPDPSQRQQMQRPMGRGGFQMAGGGRVPASASPSGGARTDDVQASLNGRRPGVNVNVGEFVIPKDVAAWKGQEFFQKLIAQSRKMRVTAPAQGGQQPQPQAMG
jgi:hypothetical protein